MASRIITLFGEELIPEKLEGAPKQTEVSPQDQEIKSNNILEDWVAEKQYYTIGEVARLFDVRTSHIRFWTKEFDLKVRTTRKGDRLYTPELIQELRSIYHLIKERGFTIAGAKTQLQTGPSIPETLDLRAALLRLRNQLLDIRNQLL
jgi:DNA-binding transcriptional MerR regulator